MHRSAASSRNLRHPPHRVPEMIGYFGPFQGHIETASHLEIRGVVDMQSRQSAMAPWPCRGPFPGHANDCAFDCSPHDKSRAKTSRGPIRAGTFLTADPVRPGFREWPVCPSTPTRQRLVVTLQASRSPRDSTPLRRLTFMIPPPPTTLPPPHVESRATVPS